MKRWTAIWLILAMLMTCVPALGEEDFSAEETEIAWEAEDSEQADAEDPDEANDADAEDLDEADDADDWEEEDALPEYDYGFLRVGNPTRMKGDFFTDMWGNATSDLDVRALIHGYDLIIWDGENGVFTTNPTVVNGILVTENDVGDRTYSLNLYSDLFYNDGTEITAWDYAFTLLLSIDPVIEQLGGKPLRKEHIVGFDDYIEGRNPALSGVRVLNDRRLEITVRHEYLPFFYEFGLLDCMPYPIAVIAPDCRIRDDGAGVYIEGDMTAELLTRTVLDPETGFRSHPAVTCGPYMLTAFDGTTADFEINPYFKGDTQGVKPVIPHIQYTLADNETMMEELGAGEYGLLNKVTKAETIQQGTALVGTGNYAPANYPRTGLTFISFNCEKPAVASQAVRQAIACCTDKDGLVMDYVGNYGLRVEGYYGMGQWMYQLMTGAMAFAVPDDAEDPEAQIQQHEALMTRWDELTQEIRDFYAFDTAKAARLLSQDGWTLNRAGEKFRPGQDDVRCKRIDGELIALDLTLAYPDGNRMAESMETLLVPALAEAGIALSLEPVEMTALLDMFYQRAERTADMLYLGTDFDVVFDPSTHFMPGRDGELTWNYTEAADDSLYQLSVEMRKTEPGDILTYCQRWIDFQQRFAELMPMLPIYSNVYFDFYPRVLHDYILSENVTWTQAIVRAYMSDIQDEEEEAEGEDWDELGEDEMMFDD